MYEMQQVRGVDYYSLIIDEDVEEDMDLDRLNQYRVRMRFYYERFIEQVSSILDVERRNKLKDWFEFNSDFIGFVKNSELNEGLEKILVKSWIS